MFYKQFSHQQLSEIYDQAKAFLIQQIPAENAAEILETYLNEPDKSGQPISLDKLYCRLLYSAQNANMKSGVIGKAIDGGVDALGKVLFDFQPAKVLANYPNGESLLAEIEQVVQPRGKMSKEKDSIWVRYCQTILSAAEFFNQFENGEQFYDWANHFYQDQRAMTALPYLISEEIYGVGCPLACDFLKELGFINYGKPDVHIKDIFVGLGLCEPKSSNAVLQKIIMKIAEAKHISAFDVDKVFWLMGSGNFEKHRHLGKNGKIGQQKKEFINYFRQPEIIHQKN